MLKFRALCSRLLSLGLPIVFIRLWFSMPLACKSLRGLRLLSDHCLLDLSSFSLLFLDEIFVESKSSGTVAESEFHRQMFSGRGLRSHNTGGVLGFDLGKKENRSYFARFYFSSRELLPRNLTSRSVKSRRLHKKIKL